MYSLQWKKKDEPFDIFSTNFMKRPFNLAYVTLECFSEIDLFCFVLFFFFIQN